MALILLEGDQNNKEPGILKLTSRQIQQTGVRIGFARNRKLVREIEATGRIAVDERRIATLTSWISGRSRIDQLLVNFKGDEVKKGQVLAKLYSPSLLSSIDEYLLAKRSYSELKSTGSSLSIESSKSLAESARRRLQRFGLKDDQIDDLGRKGISSARVPTIAIKSPISGTVLQKPVEEGGYVKEGDVLLCLADLSKLWLLFDVYEYELPLIKVGQELIFTTRSQPGQSFSETISFIDPTVNKKTRTIRVRCNIDNKKALLKPGMYARVQVRSKIPKALSVPESAVIQSGRRAIVIVAESGGRFRPKLVKLGRRYLYSSEPMSQQSATRPSSQPTSQPGSRPSSRPTSRPTKAPVLEPAFDPENERYHEILSGLSEGDQVVTSGNFLLNAEAQFQGILKKMITIADKAERGRMLPGEVRKTLNEILQKYLLISTALVKDDANHIPATANALSDLIVQLRKGPDWARLDTKLQEIVEGLAAAANSLAGPQGKDPSKARKHFASLSRNLVSYVRDFTPNLVADEQLHVFECTMAKDPFGYTYWLQKEPKIANPYMGQAMPG